MGVSNWSLWQIFANKNIVILRQEEVNIDILRESIKDLSREYAQSVAQEQTFEQIEVKQEPTIATETSVAQSHQVDEMQADGLDEINVVGVQETAKSSSVDIIDRFLQQEDLRIVAPDDDAEIIEVVNVESTKPQQEVLASEQLAKIYLSQGLYDEAIDIYSRLSLLKSEKSVYFAEQIIKIKTAKAKGEILKETQKEASVNLAAMIDATDKRNKSSETGDLNDDKIKAQSDSDKAEKIDTILHKREDKKHRSKNKKRKK